MAIPANLQRKPFLAPIGIAALAAVGGALVLLVAVWLLATSRSTTILVVPEAEALAQGADPALSPAGQARAELLARMLGDPRLGNHVGAVYVSPTARSRATAAPLAELLRLGMTVDREDDPRALARRVLHEHRNGRVLIVGSSGNVPATVAALSGDDDIPAIKSGQYGALYIVTVPRIGRSSFVSVAY